MNYETFKKLITELQSISNRYSKLYQLGIDLLSYDEPLHRVTSILMEEAFGKEGKEWIDWFLYERVSHSGEILKAWAKNGNEICYDIDSLWNELKDIKNEKTD